MKIAALWLALGFCLADTVGWETQFRQGLELMREQKYAEARRRFERVTELNPRYSQAFFYLGMSALHTGDRQAAETALTHAIELEPKAQSALYNLGLLRLQDSRPKEAIAYLEKARHAGPLSPELALYLTQAYLEAGENRHALGIAETGASQFPNLADFHALSGRLLFEHGLAEPACTFLSTADRLEPGQSKVALRRAAACLAGKNLEAARAALAGVAGKSQSSIEFHSLSAKLQLASGQKQVAIEEMESAVRLQPDDPRLLLELGRFYQKAGNQQKALETLQKAAALDPKLPDIPYSMAVSYITADDDTNAVQMLERTLRIDPRFDRALFLLGSIHLWRQRLDAADQALAEALRVAPKNPFYHCFMGMLRASQTRPADAETEFRQAIALDASYALPHFHLGRTLAREGKQAEAQSEFERALALEPELPEAYYELGLLLRKRGQTAKAAEAMAQFKKFRDADSAESAVVLKQLQNAVR